ncbi:MAG TPA: phosphatase PAP2 family protein [Caulobacteraceae bacterium]|nr:phosphatase PAP2 family protein [Caulobacteraceae bacterium]
MSIVESESVAPTGQSLACAILANVGADAPLYAIIGVYCAAAWAFGEVFHLGGAASLTLYLWPWFGMAAAWTTILVLLKAIFALVRWAWTRVQRGGGLLAAEFARVFPKDLLARLVSGLMLFLGVCLFLGAYTLIKNCLPRLRPYYFDPILAGLDRATHLGHDPWRLVHPVLGALPIQTLEGWYYLGWPLIIGLCPLLAAISRGNRALASQFLLAFLLAWIVLGTLAAGAFMSGGPVFYGRITGDMHRYAALSRYLSTHAMPVADRLWTAYRRQQVILGSGISDFPSMHVVMITLAALLARRLRPLLGVAVGAFGLLILGTSVALGWHYAVGDYVAVIGAWALWRAAGVLVRSPLWRPLGRIRATPMLEPPARPIAAPAAARV